MRLLVGSSAFRFGTKATWYNAELHKPSFGEIQKVTLIPGIGIGPEITSISIYIHRFCSRSI